MKLKLYCLIANIFLFVVVALADDLSKKDPLIDHGRYLSIISGCNDCHTPGFAESGGNVPEKEWLTGVPVGYRGPWGTTYAINLRSIVPAMKEDEWLKFARSLRSRPPMPTYVFKTMNDDDLRGLYRFISSLGPTGSPMPQYVPPGTMPDTPYIDFVPKEPK